MLGCKVCGAVPAVDMTGKKEGDRLPCTRCGVAQEMVNYSPREGGSTLGREIRVGAAVRFEGTTDPHGFVSSYVPRVMTVQHEDCATCTCPSRSRPFTGRPCITLYGGDEELPIDPRRFRWLPELMIWELINPRNLPEKGPEWCWCEEGDEHCWGPFSSREECLQDARCELGDLLTAPGTKLKIRLGHVKHALPEDHIGVRVEDLLEGMDTCATDNEFGCAEESIFQVEDTVAAQASLDKVLQAWAKRWAIGTYWIMEEPTETVEVTVEGKTP